MQSLITLHMCYPLNICGCIGNICTWDNSIGKGTCKLLCGVEQRLKHCAVIVQLAVLQCRIHTMAGTSSKVLQNCRPAAFDAKSEAHPKTAEIDDIQPDGQCHDSSDGDGMPPLYQNNNRQVIHQKHESDSSEDE